jgi:nitrile hydratase accessory protein
LSRAEPPLDPLALGQLAQLPRDADEPVFAQAWQAQAFALVIELSRRGHFSWPEWTAALAAELKAADAGGGHDDGRHYYDHWLAALERLVLAKGLTDPAALEGRMMAWIEAYQHTPHGKPVLLTGKKDLSHAYGGRSIMRSRS